MSVFRGFIRLFFHHFYHGFAWTYNSVAALVSIGRWDDWTRTVIPYVRGASVLEIGHGPGCLQLKLMDEKRHIFGLDESAQMGRLTKRLLAKAGYHEFRLTRGLGEMLPFADETFDTVVSTFPTEYMFEAYTLLEIRRVLHSTGLLVILPAAWIVGQKVLDRSAAWLFKITGQSPAFSYGVISQHLKPSFEQAGFNPEFLTVETKSSVVLIVIAAK
jgi:ubiquinone/menaquinone biosynthesis C-methylase UbiE